MPNNRLTITIISKFSIFTHFLRISAYEERIIDGALPFTEFPDFRLF